jgi:hypothetical protein
MLSPVAALFRISAGAQASRQAYLAMFIFNSYNHLVLDQVVEQNLFSQLEVYELTSRSWPLQTYSLLILPTDLES